MLAVALVIGLSNTGSGAAHITPAADKAAPVSSERRGPTGDLRSDSCRSARKALRYYRASYVSWRDKMGAGSRGGNTQTRPGASLACPRYLSRVWQSKAHAARLAYLRWHRYHWEYRRWLPAKWIRIGICETGLNWQHSNSSYEGAFGFALSSWDAFVPRADPKAGPYPANAYLATPRQQYEVALAIWRQYGLSGWGCRGA